jgi:hypothetical protein
MRQDVLHAALLEIVEDSIQNSALSVSYHRFHEGGSGFQELLLGRTFNRSRKCRSNPSETRSRQRLAQFA